MTLVLVTGGTGRAGRPVVQRLHDAGHQLRVLSHTREPAIGGVDHVKADLVTGEGVDQAVRGASIVIHCAGAPSFRRDQAMTANLVRAAKQLPAPPANCSCRACRERSMSRHTRDVIVVSQPSRLATSSAPARAARSQASCTASSASLAEPSIR